MGLRTIPSTMNHSAMQAIILSSLLLLLRRQHQPQPIPGPRRQVLDMQPKEQAQEIEMVIDPVCLVHGMPWSANPPHWAGKCMFCCLCFKELKSTADCNSLSDGSYEDVCIECAQKEAVDVR